MKTNNEHNNGSVYMEHANITVTNLDEGIRFFQTAFPAFKVRGGGTHNGRKWVHLGDDYTYLAINQQLNDSGIKPGHPDYTTNGINHIGFVVQDVEAITIRLMEAGFKRDFPKQVQQFRIRDYFADNDGNQYEFVQYLSDEITERNTYDD